MKKLMIFTIVILITASCRGQRKFYKKETAFINWKESILNAIDSLSEFQGVHLRNFFVTASQVRYSTFSGMLDTLRKYKAKESEYYIVLDTYMGETAVTELAIRSFDKNGGREVRAKLEPGNVKIFSSVYLHDEKLFRYIYDSMKLYRIPLSHLLSVSILKNGRFETRILSADNVEKGNMVRKLLTDLNQKVE